MAVTSGELIRKIRYSKGMKFLDREYRLGFSYHVFAGNLSELLRSLATIESPEVGIKLHSQDHHHERVHVHREANRLFHNFLASAKTLIDHTRAFMTEEYHNTSVEKAYLDKVREEFAADGLMKFVQDLRNYSLHKGIPNNSMSLKLTNGDTVKIDSSIYLEKKDLVEWDRWSGAAKRYLEQQEDSIPLAIVATQYGDKVTKFFEWIQSSLREYHKSDLEELNQLRAQFKELETSRATLAVSEATPPPAETP